jgi:hypothetical protein
VKDKLHGLADVVDIGIKINGFDVEFHVTKCGE